MTVRAIIADDEPLSVEMIRVLLEELDGGIEIVATCSSGEETLARVAELRPDLLLLDVNMPQLDGMSVATALAKDDGYKPHIVFTTAHAEFAAQAFDVVLPDLAGLGPGSKRAAFLVAHDGTIKYSEETATPGDLPNFAALAEAIKSL